MKYIFIGLLGFVGLLQDPIVESGQLVVVIVPDANSFEGELYKFEKRNKGWLQVGPAHAITIGANGVAWSKSDLKPPTASYKKEGDKRSPAGIFPLKQSFGRLSKEQTEYLLMPYEKIGPNAQCIEDNSSSFYNQIVFDNTQVTPDWNQDDRMLREDELYDWGIFVDHNASKTPGDGSCIFIHIWSGEGKPTAGCTAMSKKHLTQLVYWLDPAKHPQLVLMASADYQSLTDQMNLPSLGH